MPSIVIDGRPVAVPAGTTILEAAGQLGIEIPTLCHVAGYEPSTSCFVCVVQVEGRRGFVPSCATHAVEGMVVHSETEAVRAIRRQALELLLSDHGGDCVGPCRLACPAGLEVGAFLRLAQKGRVHEAAAVVRRRLALPAALGRVCPRFCERVCRRQELDEAVAIGPMHGWVAEADLAEGGTRPAVGPDTGRHVAVVGAGPAGLSAAWHLRLAGHACTVFDANEEPGGLFRYGLPAGRLPREVLAAEVDLIRRAGVTFRLGWRLGVDAGLDELRAKFDAVFLAIGAARRRPATLNLTADAPRPEASPEVDEVDAELLRSLGLEVRAGRLAVERGTWATSRPGVFAGGEVVSGAAHGVHAVASGRLAAESIDAFLRGRSFEGKPRRFHSRRGRLSEREKAAFYQGVERRARQDNIRSAAEARLEAGRCLQCDCLKEDDCRLRLWASRYGARQGTYRGERRPVARVATHPEVVFEPAKCIQCALCVQAAERAGEPVGLAMVDRGFQVQPAVPFQHSWADALQHAAQQCVRICPTGALAARAER